MRGRDKEREKERERERERIVTFFKGMTGMYLVEKSFSSAGLVSQNPNSSWLKGTSPDFIGTTRAKSMKYIF